MVEQTFGDSTEDALGQKTNDLAALYDASQEFLAETDAQALLEIICRLAVERFGFKMAWLGLVVEGDCDVHHAASYGFDEGYLDFIRITWDDGRTGRGPTTAAIHTGKPIPVNRIDTDPSYEPWREEAQARGYRSSAALPLCYGDKVLGALNVYSAEADFFDPDRLQVLQSLANQAAVATQNARLREQTHADHERLQTLSRRLAQVQETERSSIARELHDEIGQSLTVMKINLQAMQHSPEGSALAPGLAESINAVERTLQKVRNLSLDLRPSLLDDLGLVPALRWYADRQAQRAEFTAHFSADLPETRLPPEIETTCFRIAQEALTNVMRHAQAQHVYVELQQHDGMLQLSVRDDGVGFDVEAALERAIHGASLGLLGMDERAQLAGGRLEISSTLGHGTEVRAFFSIDLA